MSVGSDGPPRASVRFGPAARLPSSVGLRMAASLRWGVGRRLGWRFSSRVLPAASNVWPRVILRHGAARWSTGAACVIGAPLRATGLLIVRRSGRGVRFVRTSADRRTTDWGLPRAGAHPSRGGSPLPRSGFRGLGPGMPPNWWLPPLPALWWRGPRGASRWRRRLSPRRTPSGRPPHQRSASRAPGRDPRVARRGGGQQCLPPLRAPVRGPVGPSLLLRAPRLAGRFIAE